MLTVGPIFIISIVGLVVLTTIFTPIGINTIDNNRKSPNIIIPNQETPNQVITNDKINQTFYNLTSTYAFIGDLYLTNPIPIEKVVRPGGDAALIEGVFYDGTDERSTIGSHNSILTEWRPLWINLGELTIVGDLSMDYIRTSMIGASELNYKLMVQDSAIIQVVMYVLSIGIILAVYFGGNIEVDGSVAAQSFTTISDVRLKTNFTETNGTYVLEGILNTMVYDYDYNSTFISFDNKQRTTGWKAGEFKKYFPNTIITSDKTFKTSNNNTITLKDVDQISKDKVIPLTWIGIQELYKNFENLKNQLNELKNDYNNYKLTHP